MKNSIKIIVVLILVAFSFINCTHKEKKATSNTVISTYSKLLNHPPLPGLDIPYQKFTIDPAKSNVLYSTRGATIHIPSHAFLDKDGTIIQGEVEVVYREFYNPLDFYLAGIPMNYNDQGEEKVLESGGMVEINATSSNEELFVNPENKIKVDLFSWTKSPDFNLYDLDKNTGRWVEKGKNAILTSNQDAELNGLPQIPPKPKVATVESFKIADDTKLFPEIEAYKNVRFEPVDISKCKISNAQEMTVKPLRNGVYEVTSIIKIGKFRKESKCSCYLAFEAGKEYNDALKQYQIKYSELLKKRDLLNKQWTDYYAIIKKYRILDIKKLDGQEKIIRTLEINNFGFVNCDYPSVIPTGGEINLNKQNYVMKQKSI
jgi:hypothetical protein